MNRHMMLIAGVLPLALAACTQPATAYPGSAANPPLGIDLGSSGHVRPAAMTMPMGEGHEMKPPAGTGVQQVHENHGGAQATGTVNSVNVAARTVNVSHQAIQALGWPPMTMDFPVVPSVDLSTIKPGSKVNFTLDKGSNGMPVIDSITSAGGGR